jgi:hypothetical protein
MSIVFWNNINVQTSVWTRFVFPGGCTGAIVHIPRPRYLSIFKFIIPTPVEGQYHQRFAISSWGPVLSVFISIWTWCGVSKGSMTGWTNNGAYIKLEIHIPEIPYFCRGYYVFRDVLYRHDPFRCMPIPFGSWISLRVPQPIQNSLNRKKGCAVQFPSVHFLYVRIWSEMVSANDPYLMSLQLSHISLLTHIIPATKDTDCYRHDFVGMPWRHAIA